MKESQEIMMEHSEVKIRLLKLYLERYLSILSTLKYIENIQIYDLFCGEGVYNHKGKGSPIVILEVIDDIYVRWKEKNKVLKTINCFFNDIDLKKIERLKNNIKNHEFNNIEIKGINYINEDYRNLVSNITAGRNSFIKEKTFVFIDPYGYKNIRVSDIKNLMKSGNTEVLLFLPTQFMFRFEKKGTPESLVDFIDELMPIELWPDSVTGIDFINNLTEAFRNTMGNSYFVDSFIITRNRNQFFCLFFFTSHIYGFEKMLDAKWKIDEEEGRGWQYHQESNLFSQVEKKPRIYIFEQKLMDFISQEKTNSDIYDFTLKCGYLPKHANEILLRLQSINKLIIERHDGKVPRKSSFYINYKSWKNEPQKVSIKLKQNGA